MISLLPSILSILITVEFVLGNFANAFIALTSYTDWVKRKKISTAHRILTALALSRIGLLWVLVINWCVALFNPALYSLEGRAVANIAWTISYYFSIWFTTSLSVLYLLKIANFSSLLFLHLKQKVERVILMILLGTSVYLVFHVAVEGIDENMWMNEYEGNITWKIKFWDSMHFSNMTLFMIANIVPFTTTLTCFVLLIFSLWKHLRRMQLSGKGSQDPSTKIHVRAMQTVISFLVFFVIYILAVIITVWSFNNLKNESIALCGEVLIALYASGHSFILIWGNKKLKQDFCSLLGQMKC